MRKLFWKDIVLIGLVLAAGLLAGGVAIFDRGFEDTFVYPDRYYFGDLGWIWLLGGLFFGITAGLLDAGRGTSDYLYARPLSQAQIFWGQVIWHMATMALIICAPLMALYWVGNSHYPASFWELGSEKIMAGTLLPLAYAAGLYASQFPIIAPAPFIAGALALFWVAGASLENTMERELAVSSTAWAVKNVICTVVLLIGARLGHKARFDRDRPIGSLTVFPIFLGLLITGWSIHYAINVQTLASGKDARRVYIAQSEDGSLHMAKNSYSRRLEQMQAFRVDPETHAKLSEDSTLRHVPEAEKEVRKLRSQATHRAYSGRLEGGAAKYIHTYAHHPLGFMAHFITDQYNLGRKVVLARPDGAFSPEAELLEKNRTDADASTVVGDPKDGTVWICDLNSDNPEYQAVPLPGGRLFRAWVQPNSDLRKQLREHILGQEVAQKDSPFSYIELDEGFGWFNAKTKTTGLMDGEALGWIAESTRLKNAKGVTYTSNGNLLRPSYRVTDSHGNEKLTFDYEPRTAKEKFSALKAYAMNALRAPVMDPIGYANIHHAHDYFGNSEQQSQPYAVLAPRTQIKTNVAWTAWSPLSLIAWALLFGLAYWTHRTIKSRGAKGPRLLLWPAAVILFGPVASIAALWAESKRAYRPVHILRPEEEPRMWLKSVG